MIIKRRWWLVGLVPLIYLPLRAQENPADNAPAPPPASAPAPAPSTSPTGAATPPAAPTEQADELSPEERVSADNSLSFPVDI